jgi:hypothetical protein
MAGKAIFGEGAVRRRKMTRAYHKVREIECKCAKGREVGHNQRQDPSTLHRQPQNMRTLMMWAAARTEKASVIG